MKSPSKNRRRYPTYLIGLISTDCLTRPPLACPQRLFLATEQRIPGLGTGVLQDILWKSRIHPRRKMAELPDRAIQDMYGAVKSVLAEMAARGGRDTERDLFGRPGGYKTILSKNTVGTPCPACGTSIKKEPYLGGSIYYCAGCQSLGGR